MLWQYIKEKMLGHPQKTLSEQEAVLTFEQAVIFAESFGQKLEEECYGILCRSELSAALAILSCFAAGKTAVPLALRYGEKHCRRIIEKIRPPYVITDIGGQLRTVDVDDGSYFCPEDPALIMCTSGTTGQPKGVMLSRENILANLKSVCGYFRIGKTDRILITRSLYHCAVLTGELLASLVNGTDVVFFSGSFDPVDIIHTIKKNGITVCCGTPTVFVLISSYARHLEVRLKSIVLSGEILSAPDAEKIRKAFPGTDIYHVYGLTEASPRVTYLSPEDFDKIPGSVGKPVSGVRVTVVCPDGTPARAGEDGEICVSGANVMIGYFRDRERTKKVLTDGILHTGDTGYMDSDGYLFVRGRADDMIIRSGMNIYPAEIENALRSDPRVRDVAAYGYQRLHSGTAIGILVQGDFSDRQQVLKLCSSLLPEYEIPSRIDIVETIPRNGFGKIIRTVPGGDEK